MDEQRFDALAKRLGASRRNLLKTMVGISGAALVDRLGTADARAARRGYNGPSVPNGPEYETKVCPRPSCCAICPTEYSVINQLAMCVLRTSQTCADCAQAVGCRIA